MSRFSLLGKLQSLRQETLRLKFRSRIYVPLTKKLRRKQLTAASFTIISNNCWGGMVYESYGLRKETPTVGMFIMPADYIKFVRDLPHYLAQELTFVDPDNSKWRATLSGESNWGTYLIGTLDDIELHMLHYHDEATARRKWNDRVKRVNYDRILYKFNDQNGCTPADMKEFMDLPVEPKIAFVSSSSMEVAPEVIRVRQPAKYTKGIMASYEPYGKSPRMNINRLLNSLGKGSQAKRIIFVSNVVGRGGAARVLLELASEFEKRGYDVVVLSYLQDRSEYPIPSGVKVIYGPEGSGSAVKVSRMKWVRGQVKQDPNAIVIAFEYFVNMQAILACLGLPNRVIVSERNDPANVGSGFPMGNLRALVYHMADGLVCQTDEARDYFSKTIQKKSRVILNPIKADLPERWEGPRRHDVVTFCRIEEQKNLEMMIDAFLIFRKKFPNYTLSIYGDGSQRERLVEYARTRDPESSITFHGARPDVHDVVRDAAMFVSSSDYEGISNSMLEALALGLPSVCTDCPCGGARMVIRSGENGILTPVGDAQAFAAAMEIIAGDDSLSQRFSLAASKVRDDLSLKMVADQWEELLAPNRTL